MQGEKQIRKLIREILDGQESLYDMKNNTKQL